MPLSPIVLALIRDEIGNDTDFNDASPHIPPQLDSLENIYTDALRGNFSPLVTALICWRRRLFSLQARSMDFTSGGKLLQRSQRIRFIERRIKALEVLADDTHKGSNMVVQTPKDVEVAAAAAEF